MIYEGHVLGIDEVPPADLLPGQAKLARRSIHEPLHDVTGLRAAGTPVGGNGHGVGVEAAHGVIEGRYPVDGPSDTPAGHGRHEGPHRRAVGAEVSERLDVEAEHPTVRIQRQLRFREVVAAVRVGEEHFRAVTVPLHRATEVPRCKKTERGFRMDLPANAEAAARVAGERSS